MKAVKKQGELYIIQDKKGYGFVYDKKRPIINPVMPIDSIIGQMHMEFEEVDLEVQIPEEFLKGCREYGQENYLDLKTK
jgi:hypothetical protein